MNILIDI